MEKYEPLISVFVCCYNMEKYVEKCIDSLIQQTYKNLEIILIDNGSKDNTRATNHLLSKRDERIVLLDIDVNYNYGNALDEAVKIAQGEFCYICDPDDYMPKDGFQKLIERQQLEDSDVVCGSRNIVYEDKETVDFDDCIDESIVSLSNNKINYLEKQYDDLFFVDPCPHSKLYRTRLLNGMIVPKVTYTDNIFYFQALMNANKVSYGKDLCCAYYLCDRKGNITTTFKPYTIKAFAEMSKGLIKNGINSKHYNKLKGIFVLREYIAFKTWIDNSHRVVGNKEELKENMILLYNSIMPFVIDNRKELISKIGETSYMSITLYDKLLTSKLFSKLVFKNSLRNIIRSKDE